MNKKIALSMLTLTIAALIWGEISYAQVGAAALAARRIGKKAQAEKDKQADIKQATKTVNVGNKTCPVLGGPVNGKDYYEYNGRRYGLCCPMCIGAFAKNPEKYAAIAEKEVGK